MQTCLQYLLKLTTLSKCVPILIGDKFSWINFFWWEEGSDDGGGGGWGCSL